VGSPQVDLEAALAVGRDTAAADGPGEFDEVAVAGAHRRGQLADPAPVDPDVDRPHTPRVDVPRTTARSRSGSGGTRPRSGNSGHPCLPGERDGDNDGYCGEGR